jgi:hypothetical protein
MISLAPVEVDSQFITSVGVTFFLGVLILSTLVPRTIAVALMAVKVAVVILYFCFFIDGSWFYGGDDLGFAERGLILYETGRNPVTIWTHHEAYYLKTATKSLSLIYFHNFVAMWMFGPHYHSPILLNLILSAGTVFFLVRIAEKIFRQREWVVPFVVFASLHWTTIVWHSFLNLKEPLVALLLSAMIYFVLDLRRRPGFGLIGLLTLGLLASRIRFYLPVLVIGGFLLAQIDAVRKLVVYKPVWALAGTIVFLFFSILIAGSEIRLFMKLADVYGFPYELIHFTLQPAPWKITEPASYLLLPALLHWVMFVPACIGGYCLWKSGFGGRVVVATVIAGLVFYGFVDVVASTRHRMPIDMLVIILHFAFLKEFVLPSIRSNRG